MKVVCLYRGMKVVVRFLAIEIGDPVGAMDGSNRAAENFLSFCQYCTESSGMGQRTWGNGQAIISAAY
jgi:hypothetical protein